MKSWERSCRGLRSAAELAADKPHGTRVKYQGGCRCLVCRSANSKYESERIAARKAGDWNGIVDAGKARQHILKLSKAGVGYRAIADVSGVAKSNLNLIRSGAKKKIRKDTETRILAVSAKAVSGGALIPAGRTWQRINHLLKEGFTKTELAKRLGHKSPNLQIRKKFITAKTAANIQRLYTIIMQ